MADWADSNQTSRAPAPNSGELPESELTRRFDNLSVSQKLQTCAYEEVYGENYGWPLFRHRVLAL